MPIEPGSLPSELLTMGMLTQDYNFAMAICGIVSAFVVILIFSRGI